MASGQRRFDEWASTYDQSALQKRCFEPLHELTLEEAGRADPSPKSIIDLGCGTGLLLKRAGTVFPGAELIGVDVSAEMIDAARAAALPEQHARFLRASAEALPLPDASFDIALSTASFHHWSDQRGGLVEVARVLRPGGVFVLTDILAVGWALGFRPTVWLLNRLEGGVFNTPAKLDGMLADAGFQMERRVPAPHFANASQVTVARQV